MSEIPPIPQGFHILNEGPVTALVAARWERALRDASLCEPGRIAGAREAGGGETGRGTTEIVPLPGSDARLILRPILHGGLLGSVFGHAHGGFQRVLDEFLVNAALSKAGAPVPEPLLALGERHGPLWQLALGTRLEEGTEDGFAWLARRPEPAELRRGAEAAGRAVRRFHDAGGSHADLHLKNLLIREAVDTAPEVLVIDLDRARHLEEVSPEQRLSELMRLYRSAIKRSYLKVLAGEPIEAFVEGYLGGDTALRERMEEFLPAERRKLALHRWSYRLRGWNR